jgi:osomolarity two-component system, phosphorelay intermediate protein YPD1
MRGAHAWTHAGTAETPNANRPAPSHRTKSDLEELSSLGHFLKGSSATLGLNKLRDSCEKIQHFGQHLDATGHEKEPDEDRCLEGIRTTLKAARKEFREVEHLLRRFYGEKNV